MNKLFGYDNFRNHIVWCYSGGGQSKQTFPRKHDDILFYSKSDKWTFNYNDPYLKTEYSVDIDGQNIVAVRGDKRYGWEGNPLGKMIEDWWFIPVMASTDSERVDYPTQKSEKLLERIIRASSNEGDTVADFFGGSGTTIAVSQRLGRKWICCDKSEKSIEVIKTRLLGNKSVKDKGFQPDIENLSNDEIDAIKNVRKAIENKELKPLETRTIQGTECAKGTHPGLIPFLRDETICYLTKIEEPLFNWNLYNNGRLIEFLTKIGIDWVSTAKIVKDDDNVIRVFTENNSLLLRINDEKTKVNLETEGGITTEFILRLENNNLNIYREIVMVGNKQKYTGKKNCTRCQKPLLIIPKLEKYAHIDYNCIKAS